MVGKWQQQRKTNDVGKVNRDDVERWTGIIPPENADVEEFTVHYGDENPGSNEPDNTLKGLTETAPVQIDQINGTDDTYGILGGAVDGSNKTFVASTGFYTPGSFQMSQDSLELDKGAGAGFIETDPENGIVDTVTAPPDGAKMLAWYETGQPVNNWKKSQSGGTRDTYGVIAGARNGINTDYTVPHKQYLIGGLLVKLNGWPQTQGTSEDWIELVPGSGTYRMAIPLLDTDEMTAEYLIPITGWLYDDSSLTLSGAINGTNTQYTVGSGSYEPGTLNVKRNPTGQTEGEDEDFVETDPENGKFDFNSPPLTDDFLATWYLSGKAGARTIARSDNVNSVSAAFTIGRTDDYVDVDASGGAVSITLPAVADFTGHHVTIRKNDSSSNRVTIVGTVNGVVDPAIIFQYDSVDLVPNGTEWMIS